tara:strand:+ start:156 stop:365 length:210 start_codon:yes stop_codon:yes gene_type:complete
MAVLCAGCAPLAAPPASGGWEALFDGETLDGWRGLDADAPPSGHWLVDEGSIHKVASSRVPPGANSGVK